MENVKRTSLKTEFSLAVALTLFLVVLASALTLLGSWRLRSWLLPDPNAVILHANVHLPDGTDVQQLIRLTPDSDEYGYLNFLTSASDPPEYSLMDTSFSIERVEASISALSPKRQVLYYTSGVCMFLLPLLYAAGGVLFCAWWFYRRKLAPAIQVLDEAMDHIREQDLDFTISCDLSNEMGQLCHSFEKMRQALWENNLQLWHTLEERRTLQSSITHDLRNPLAIVSGSVEYLQENLSDLPEAEIAHTLSNIAVTAERMERYTASLKKLNSLEDTRMQPSETALPDFFTGLTESLQVLARPRVLEVEQSIPHCTVRLDPEMVCRVLENLTANAARYAEHTIRLSFSLEENLLTARLTDDGPGFPAQVLKHRDGLFPSGDSSDVHMGLGLAASRIFCQKHGGALKLSNLPSGGACAEASFAIEQVSEVPDP